MLTLSTTIAFGLWAVVLGPLALKDPGRGAVTGYVSVNGEAAPGAKIQVVGDTEASAVTNEKGEYQISGLPEGIYTITAQLAGFRTSARERVAIVTGQQARVNFSLKPGVLVEILWLEPEGGLAGAWSKADTVVHLRIRRVLGAKPWPLSPGTEVICTLHEAGVQRVVNRHPSAGPNGATLQLLQETAGQWSSDSLRVTGNEPPYSAGQEYIAFLDWEPTLGVFRRLAGPLLMVPVANGRVGELKSEALGITEGTAVDSFLSRLATVDSRPTSK